MNRKMLFAFVLSCLLFPGLFAQSFNLTVENGYGSGMYNAGDTVHIWSQEWSAAGTFSHWSGDTMFLRMPLEWHTQVVMPARAVTVKANTQLLPTGTANYFSFEQIRGKHILKPVYYYFPANGDPDAVVWLWHGTGGSAQNWIWRNFEMRQFCNYLVANNMAIIVTESDESTLNTDLDGDGNRRYNYTADTINNWDAANVRAIRDTFINRGIMSPATPQAAVGFSAGGTFAITIATLLNWKAAINHNSAGTGYIQFARVPVLFSMSQRDAHPDVGAAGNQEAYDNYLYLTDQDQCTGYDMLRPSPTYPERFQRIPSVTKAQSIGINSELLANNCLDNEGYLSKSPNQIEALVIANPQNWPTLLTLSDTLREYVKDELAVMWTAHAFHHDFMARDLAFIKALCANTTVAVETPVEKEALTIFPNPAGDKIYMSQSAGMVRIMDLQGRVLVEKRLNNRTELDVAHLSRGMYILEVMNKGKRTAIKWVKQ